MRRARWKRKNVSAGRSAQAQTSCRRRGKVGNPARRSETETPGPWGTLQPGDVRDTSSFSFRCRWPVVDESLRSGPMRASASTNARAARSEAERAEREAGQMRSCTPTTSAPSATGRQSGKSQKSIACPKARPNRSRHWYADPRTRGGPLHRSAPGAFLFGPCTARFSFGKTKEKWGVHPRWTSPLAGASTLEAAVRRSLPLPADQLIQRQAVEIRQGNQCGQGRFPQTQLIVLIGAPTDSNFHRKSLLTQVSCCSQLKKMFRKCHGHPLFS